MQPKGLQHSRFLWHPLSPRVCSKSCPLSRWCHPNISSSVAHFSSCPQSFPSSGSFQMSQLFTSGGQSIGTSTSASVLPMNIQGWYPLKLAALISLLSKGLSGVFFSTTVSFQCFHYFSRFQCFQWQCAKVILVLLFFSTSLYSWPLNTMVLNYVSLLLHEFFSVILFLSFSEW